MFELPEGTFPISNVHRRRIRRVHLPRKQSARSTNEDQMGLGRRALCIALSRRLRVRLLRLVITSNGNGLVFPRAAWNTADPIQSIF